MKKTILATMIALLTTSAALAQRDARQEEKNLMRNLGIGLGAAALKKASKGDTRDALMIGAAAAYAGKKYEDARKAQRSERRVYRYKNGRKVGFWRVASNGRRLSYTKF